MTFSFNVTMRSALKVRPALSVAIGCGLLRWSENYLLIFSIRKRGKNGHCFFSASHRFGKLRIKRRIEVLIGGVKGFDEFFLKQAATSHSLQHVQFGLHFGLLLGVGELASREACSNGQVVNRLPHPVWQFSP
jgi:hypothetical protein